MKLETLINSPTITPEDLIKYCEVSFNIAVGLRPATVNADYNQHLNTLVYTDSLIAGYVNCLTLLN